MSKPALRCPDAAQAATTMRQTSLEKLRDAGSVENELLPYPGLNGEMPSEFPAPLYPWYGHGPKPWQYPNQFRRYPCHLSDEHLARRVPDAAPADPALADLR